MSKRLSSNGTSSSSRMIRGLVRLVKEEFQKVADFEKAKDMKRYVKTTMPMYGVMRLQRSAVEKEVYRFIDKEVSRLQPLTDDWYPEAVTILWNLPHREEKYLAIDLALHYKRHIALEHLGLYESMLREGFMWWDLVDPIAVNLIGKLTRDHAQPMEPTLREWIQDDNIWVRRTAILAQLKLKEQTNGDMLFEFCRQRMHEKDFFIRKASGWALREYSKSNPQAVMDFLREEKSNMPGLTYREASKVLRKQGKM